MNKSAFQNQESKICLTIAGLDPSGGAGIIADIKTFSAFGCFAAAAVTSITFQNTTGVFGAVHQTAASLRGQILPVIEDFPLAAIKTGMLPTREVIEETARLIEENDLPLPVVDPVVRSTSGFDLIDDEALRVLIEKLFPLAEIITPNIPEAERIARMKIQKADDIEKAARLMQTMGANAVLIKGGHLPIADLEYRENEPESIGKDRKNEGQKAIDFMFVGEEKFTYSADFIKTTATHGTGCTFAAAVAANLALGKSLPDAVETAKKFVTEAIRQAPHIGKGNSPINHFVKIN